MEQVDLVIDATVNRSVSAAWTTWRARGLQLPLLAQISTDVPTGSLGLVTVCPPTSRLNPEQIDERVGHEVAGEAALEAFRVFWDDMEPADALVPTLGCSVPTYHGSAADLAAVSSSALNLVCRHLGSEVAGSHLFALPHSGVTPAHRFLQAA